MTYLKYHLLTSDWCCHTTWTMGSWDICIYTPHQLYSKYVYLGVFSVFWDLGSAPCGSHVIEPYPSVWMCEVSSIFVALNPFRGHKPCVHGLCSLDTSFWWHQIEKCQYKYRYGYVLKVWSGCWVLIQRAFAIQIWQCKLWEADFVHQY